MPSKNKEVLKKHRDAWYLQNKEKQIARQKVRREALRLEFWQYKRTLKCLHCGMPFKDNPECCDFHHTDPREKEGTVYSRILNSRASFQKELAKCIPLCANCHRKVHKEDLYKKF